MIKSNIYKGISLSEEESRGMSVCERVSLYAIAFTKLPTIV